MMFALLFTKDAKDIEQLTIVDFGLGPSSDHANVESIGSYSEFDDLMDDKPEDRADDLKIQFKNDEENNE